WSCASARPAHSTNAAASTIGLHVFMSPLPTSLFGGAGRRYLTSAGRSRMREVHGSTASRFARLVRRDRWMVSTGIRTRADGRRFQRSDDRDLREMCRTPGGRTATAQAGGNREVYN